MNSYEFWSLIINTFIAIGTVGAVISALYLAGNQAKPKISISNRIVRIYNHPSISEKQQYVNVSATNVGIVRERISTYGYSIGILFWKKMAQVNPSLNKIEAHSFPDFIDPGECISDFIEIEKFNELQMDIFTKFIDEINLPRSIKTNKFFINTVLLSSRCWVSPSRGKIIRALPDKTFRDHITKQYIARGEK